MSKRKGGKGRRPIAVRILKWTGITVGTLIVLIIIAIIVIPHVVNTSAVKHEIERVASNKTGRSITIAGPLSLSLFPWIGFDAHDVTMANAAGFGDKPFMHVKEAEIHAKLIPLIFGTVDVSGITFDTPTINLARKKNGNTNWQDLTGSKKGSKQNGAGKNKNAPLANLSIAHVAINDATLDYRDAESGKHYTVNNFGLKANGLAPGKEFPLSFHTRLASNHPHFRADIQFDAKAEFDKTARKLNLAGGNLTATVTSFGGSEPIKLDAKWKRLALNGNTGTATLSGMLLSLSDLRARLDAKAEHLDSKRQITGHLDIAPFSPRKVLAAIGDPVPQSLKGFNKASLSADIAGKSNSLSFTHLVATLDNSKITGSAGMANLSKRSLDFDLALDHLDLADYLASGGGAQTRLGAVHGTTFMETRLPGRLLQNLDLAGKLAIGKFSGFGLKADNLALTLNAASGTLHIAPIQATLYSGTYQGNITLTAAGQGMHLETSEKLQAIDLGNLLETLTGKKQLRGTSDLNFTLTGQGSTVGELLATLKGSGDLSIKNGALEGINLWDSLRRAWVLVKEHKRVPAKGPELTKIVNLKTHAVIDKGKLTTDTLVARLPFLAVSGHGNVNFLKHNAVDYRLLATVVKTPKISGENLTQLENAEVPIRVSGNLTSLSVYPDIETALKARAQSEVKKKLDKQKKDLKKKLVQELLGNRDKDKNGGG
ncbi:MAG: AsmA family protein [Gammaproteobacteria bacterium]